ncbi:MAG: single-stranded DNA-binding protein [Verrucomicrobiae bacterium]|nr:single-stranded DNA-binding protein [Verrucomicrobiae bacterium]
MSPLEPARQLSRAVGSLLFSDPVCGVYNPLDYAWEAHAEYVRRFATGPKRVLFLGMNPGPWGMAQTGVPFGEVAAVRDWMGIRTRVGRPAYEHPKRPIQGFDCPKSEVSGRRLWGLFRERFGSAPAFFKDHFVLNYCPLVFMGRTGANITPDKIPAPETNALFKACDTHLLEMIRLLSPQFLVGVGGFAEGRLRDILPPGLTLCRILHPSPASPAANRDWAGTATRQLKDQGVWE